MRVRLRKRKPTIGVECQRCLRRRYYVSLDEFKDCPCGGKTGTFIMGRIDWVDDGHAQERVEYQRAALERAHRHIAGRRRTRFVFRKRNEMAKFKIVKRAPEARAAQPGTTKTGAKVEKVKAGKGQPGSAAGRFIGRTTGLSVTKFQNKSLEDNRKRHLSDTQLVRLWKSEFPNAKSNYTEAIVAGVRGAYNRGKHGNNDGEPLPENKRVPQYDDDGNPLPFRGERAAARREAKAEKAPAKTKSRGKVEAAPVKKLKKVAR